MSGTEVSAVHRAFSNLLTTLTPEQVQKFMEEVNASAAVAARAPASDPTQGTEVLSSKASSAAMEAPEPTEAMTRPVSRKRSRENAKLRPLNSFIAFRSFYSAAFPDLSQKVKSGLLRLLWSSDPFKAKWAIVAKAYSVIRDKHIGQVTLESFLALIGPFIGLVSVANYLDTMGLQVVSTEDKHFSLIKANPNVHINPMDLTTNLSVDDIVQYCYQIGYVSGIHAGSASENQGAAVSMAVSAQSTPKSPAAKAGTPKNHASSGQTAGHQVGEHITVLDTNSPKENGSPQTPQVNTSVAPSNNNALPAPPVDNSTTPPAAPINNARTSGPYTQADFEGDLRRAMNNFPFGNNDGYYDLFNPGLRTRVYNPYCSQFDGFDINDYVEIDQSDASDFTGKLLQFSDKLEIPELNGEILGENGQSKDRHREVFKAHARLFEDEANYRLFQHVQEHGPASIYWRAFREYFTGEIINMVESHWRPDPRCAQVRIDAHNLAYQAINEVPFMSTAERNLVIRATGSYPEDAMSFFTSMTRNRLTYLMVKEMSDLFFFRIRTLAGREIDLNMEREMASVTNWTEYQ